MPTHNHTCKQAIRMRARAQALTLGAAVALLVAHDDARVRGAAARTLVQWGEAAAARAAPTLTCMLSAAAPERVLGTGPQLVLSLSHTHTHTRTHVHSPTHPPTHHLPTHRPTLAHTREHARTHERARAGVAAVLSHLGEAWARHAVGFTLAAMQRADDESARAASRAVTQV